MKIIKALLFDLDGTLIDSEYFHYECWNEILEEYNVRLTYPDWLKNYAGIPLPVNAKNLLEKYAIDASLPEVVKRREALTLERLKTKDVNLMPFALEVIRCFAIQSNTEQHEALQIADKLFLDLKEAKNYLLSDQFMA